MPFYPCHKPQILVQTQLLRRGKKKNKKNPTSTAQTTGRLEPFNVLLAEIVAFQVCFLLALSGSQEMLAGMNMLSFNYRTGLLLQLIPSSSKSSPSAHCAEQSFNGRQTVMKGALMKNAGELPEFYGSALQKKKSYNLH